MNQLNTILLQQQQGGGMSSILMIVGMIVVFYFFMIRPQQKKQKELKKQRESMQKGDKVVTAGGIHGKIKEVQETTLHIWIAPEVWITVDKGSVFMAGEQQESAEKK